MIKNFKTSFLPITVLCAAAWLGNSAEAGVFKITPGTAAGAFAGQQGLFEAFLERLENEVNAELPSVETGEYTKGMANATAMAMTGSATAYGPVFSLGLIGVNAGVGVDLGKGNSISDFDAKKAAGFGTQVAVTAGLNPSALYATPFTERLQLFLGFMAASRKVDDVEADFTSIGATAKYKLYAPKNLASSLVKWQGLDVSAGIRYAKLKGTFTQILNEQFTDSVSGQTATVTGPATIGGDVKVFSIPIEASSTLRLAYFLNLIGGAAVDFNFGSSTAIANYVSDIDLGGNGTATGELDLGGKTSPTMLNARAFLGTGVEFAVGSLNLIVGKSLNARAWSVNTMLNFFW